MRCNLIPLMGFPPGLALCLALTLAGSLGGCANHVPAPSPAAPPRVAKTFAAPPFAAGESFEMEKTRKFLAEGGAANSAPPEETSQATHLHQAATYGWFHVAELLLEHGAEINALNKDHRTPLATTIDHGHVELAQLLIERGADIHLADVHARSSNGNTALHVVGRESLDRVQDRYDVARFLLEKGVDVNARNAGGRTPLDTHSNDRIVELLRQHGGKRGTDPPATPTKAGPAAKVNAGKSD